MPDPNAPGKVQNYSVFSELNMVSEEEEQETAIRHLTLWRDGFSIEDGELMRYGNPRNEQILAEINSGYVYPILRHCSSFLLLVSGEHHHQS